MIPILKHPRVAFAIYSSIAIHNIQPIVDLVFGKTKLAPYVDKVLTVFDQDFNVPDP